MSDVIVFKTISGEEVIATLDSKQSDIWVLKNARILFPQQKPDGTIALTMVPFITVAENPDSGLESNVLFHTKNLLAELVNIPATLEKSYLSQMSGIVLVK